jgi:chloride channel protein, CIC family
MAETSLEKSMKAHQKIPPRLYERSNGKVLERIISTLREQQHLLIDTVVLGVVGAFAAQSFSWMLSIANRLLLKGIAGYQSPILPNEGGNLTPVIGSLGLALIPLCTTLGGLLSGILVYTLAPEAEGHGTDTAVKAYHFRDGVIRGRIPFIKMVASAITIGSGGAAGREGPTALITAGIGSIYASLTKRTAYERRFLLMIGMAAGLAAIFRSPIGTALFAVEVLYGGMEFEAGALLYTMLGSIIAYAVNGLFVGYQPIFRIPTDLATPGIAVFPWYILLGVAAGLVATIIPVVFYRVRDVFTWLPVPPHIKPAIGGLALGLIAMRLPQVLSGGYGWIQMAINGSLPAGLLLTLSLVMVFAFSLTIGSGGSGGVFAPSLFVGAMLGAFFAKATGQSSAAFAVVGMAAVFSGAARVPLATMLMVTEMTGGYTLLVPAGMAVMLSYLVQEALSSPIKYKSLYEAQVPVRFHSPAHQLEQVENVFRMLKDHPFQFPSSIDHIDLRNLLVRGAPIGLPDHHQLVFFALRAKSPLVGEHANTIFNNEIAEQMQIIAFFREGHFIMPFHNPQLKPGDRVLAVVTPAGRQFLEQNFEMPDDVIVGVDEKVAG